MHKLTKREAEEFIKSQNYDIILSAKINNWSAEEETVYYQSKQIGYITYPWDHSGGEKNYCTTKCWTDDIK